ncbi:MAG TPA: hypothetical protein VLE96_02380, partial [Chlamydiales bacterium]|nr:hypothetical protein [Chlamydiales bacterium]
MTINSVKHSPGLVSSLTRGEGTTTPVVVAAVALAVFATTESRDTKQVAAKEIAKAVSEIATTDFTDIKFSDDSNRDRYEGNWENDKKHGQGTHHYANGDRYEGNWENDKKHGEGTLHYANGDRYVGNWKNDKKHGQGKYYCANGVR